MINTTTILIEESYENQRIDICLSNLTDFSRSMIQKLIYDEKIKINNEIALKANYKVKTGDLIEITNPEYNKLTLEKNEGDIDILYEDDAIIVLNKAAHLITHPGAGNANNTLANFLANYCDLSNLNGPEKLGVVHRLDKGVSGCIIFAKTNEAHLNLNEQFQNRLIKKIYYALSYNKNEELKGSITSYISRSSFNRKKMASSKDETSGKYSFMEYEIEDCFYLNPKDGFISFIKCTPQTGRMHQIRLQLSSIKLPIIGDELYGNKQNKEILNILGNRIALHASSITFLHPLNNKEITIEAPIPEEFLNIINTYKI